MPLRKLSIQGFRSIENLADFDMKSASVLVGPNGSGKSNLVDFFNFLSSMIDRRLYEFVEKEGGYRQLLFLGGGEQGRLASVLNFHSFSYRFSLIASDHEYPIFDEEAIIFHREDDRTVSLGSGHRESRIGESLEGADRDELEELSRCCVYHFDYTSDRAEGEMTSRVDDDQQLNPRGTNLPSILYRMKSEQPDDYDILMNTIGMGLRFFEGFIFETRNGDNLVEMGWRQRNWDSNLSIRQLSDGSMRLILLFAALLQPSPPPLIILDEPELGLHPAVIEVFAELVQSIAPKTRVIVTTQSEALLDCFKPDQVVVVERDDAGASQFRRLNEKELAPWLERYSLGQLWSKNILGGRPLGLPACAFSAKVRPKNPSSRKCSARI